MSPADLGHNLLLAAIVIAGITALLGLVGAAGRALGVRLARWGLAAVALLVSGASVVLLATILRDDFSLAYVASYSEQALPLGYKVAAFWAGQAGSLLLWTWLIAAMGLVATLLLWRRPAAVQGAAVATIAAIVAFFLALMIAVPETDPFEPVRYMGQLTDVQRGQLGDWARAHNDMDPFEHIAAETGAQFNYIVDGLFYVTAGTQADADKARDAVVAIVGPIESASDGRGLNPMLQDPAMVLHPPLLFVGYAGFTIPLALLMGALAAGALDRDLVERIRRWVMASWIFLGVGILLGSWWAYVELGWGGYWAWDPVENASLLPWLSGAALLHVLVVVHHRRMFKGLTAALVVVTFLLCIFGTFLTRSGMIASVHAFSKSNIGWWFLGMMAAVAGVTLIFAIIRYKALRADDPTAEWDWREYIFAAAALFLLLMTAMTMFGTMRPLWGAGPEAGPEGGIAIDPRFYNNMVLVLLGIPTVMLMAFGPLIAYGKKLPTDPLRLLGFCGIAAGMIFVMVVLLMPSVGYEVSQAIPQEKKSWLTDNGNAAAGVVAVIFVGAIAFIVLDFIRQIGSTRRATGLGSAGAAVYMLDANHRRYGAQLAHLGIVLLAVAIVGAGLFDKDLQFVMREGETKTIGATHLTYEKLTEVHAATHTAATARITVTDPRGRVLVMQPELRRYHKWPQMRNSEVDMRTTVAGDLYVALTNKTANGEQIALRVLIKPLMLWLWVGGTLICLGGLLAITPRLAPRWQPVAKAAPARPVGVKKPNRISPAADTRN